MFLGEVRIMFLFPLFFLEYVIAYCN
jgi:hypothetical protein